jgi:type III restriction enzyme
MLELKQFQIDSAGIISKRYALFANADDRPHRGPKPRPFFQALSALTGAGKTPILAQAVALMRAHFESEPIVFWISKARSVVTQTYNNFSPGGKYYEILDGFKVVNVQDLRPEFITDGKVPLIITATTGLFNNKEQAEGSLNIYKNDQDLFGDASPWVRLIAREHEGRRRPLLIVYDEGHNLSDQQTNILAELEPEAYLLASATLKLPASFQKSVIQPVTGWVEEFGDIQELAKLGATTESGEADSQRFITTAVSSGKVVKAQLVKKAIQFDGTTAAMERSIDELIARQGLIRAEAKKRGVGLKPKAIYVCRTNIADDGQKDDPAKPFEHRAAPPIRIWRYLVDVKQVSPKDIAIYADLKFAEGNKPDAVNLFNGGESDFDKFQSQNYQHIIFNLSLQEGWDDPACYLAYIDKGMGSSIQVEQVIGRVLRQYGAEHYGHPALNSAHFFIRVDKESVFTDTIAAVKSKLELEGAPIEISQSFSKGGTDKAEDLEPKDVGSSAKLHNIFVDSDAAKSRIAELVDDFPSFKENDFKNTAGVAHAASATVDVLDPAKTVAAVKWKQAGFTNPVRLRWLLTNAIRARSARAFTIVDLTDSKFDVRVQVQSKADKLAEKLAAEIVSTFYQWSDLAYESAEPFLFGPIRTQKVAAKFKNGLYQRYSDLNPLELDLAKAIDEIGALWHRNSPSGGFGIPLLSEGDSSTFYPDFIVWHKKLVFCLDTKGGHLLTDAIARKLFDIKEDNRTKVLVRFISVGKQTVIGGKAVKGGYSVWKMKSGAPIAIHVTNMEQAVIECLKA